MVTDDVNSVVTEDVNSVVADHVNPVVDNHVHPVVVDHVNPVAVDHVNPVVDDHVNPVETVEHKIKQIKRDVKVLELVKCEKCNRTKTEQTLNYKHSSSCPANKNKEIKIKNRLKLILKVM